jgi:hypothetical protein
MFKVIRNGSNRLDIELSGKLDSKEMERALDEFELKCQDIEDGIMLYDIVNFHLPSFSAIAVKVSRLPSMFGLIRKFRKAALLTDKEWLKKVSEFEGILIPNLEIKAFDRDQLAEAERWLSE